MKKQIVEQLSKEEPVFKSHVIHKKEVEIKKEDVNVASISIAYDNRDVLLSLI